jgi:hypothetical protein
MQARFFHTYHVSPSLSETQARFRLSSERAWSSAPRPRLAGRVEPPPLDRTGFAGRLRRESKEAAPLPGAGCVNKHSDQSYPFEGMYGERRLARTSALPACAFEALPLAEEPLSSPPALPRRRPPPLLPPPPPAGSFGEGRDAERSALSGVGAEEVAARGCGGPAVRMSVEEGGRPAAAAEGASDESGSSSGSRYLPLKWEGHLSSTPRPLLLPLPKDELPPLPPRGGGRGSPAAPPPMWGGGGGGGERVPRTRR